MVRPCLMSDQTVLASHLHLHHATSMLRPCSGLAHGSWGKKALHHHGSSVTQTLGVSCCHFWSAFAICQGQSMPG